MKNNKLSFNWFDNPDESLILLKPTTSKQLLQKLKRNYITNINISKDFNDIGFIFQLRDSKPIRIKTLKKILDSLKLNYKNFNKHIKAIGGSKFVYNINLPINLNKIESAILIAAFMSDGNNQLKPLYANVGYLGDKVLNAVQSFIPNIPWAIYDKKLRFHTLLYRILLKLEVPEGNKTILNPKIPKLIYKNKKYKKEYLTQVFDDEGHAATKASRKIVLGRSVAINSLPNKFIKNLIYKKKIYFNSLPENIKDVVNKQPPNLLSMEYKLLKEFKIKSSIRCRGVTKYLDWVSTDWVIEIAGKENMGKFNKLIGFSHPDKIKQMNLYLNN